MKSILSPEDAADYLGYSIHSMQRWRCHGGGPKYIKINERSIRYQKDDLDEWISQFGLRKHTSQAKPDKISCKRQNKRLRLSNADLIWIDKYLASDEGV